MVSLVNRSNYSARLGYPKLCLSRSLPCCPTHKSSTRPIEEIRRIEFLDSASTLYPTTVASVLFLIRVLSIRYCVCHSPILQACGQDELYSKTKEEGDAFYASGYPFILQFEKIKCRNARAVWRLLLSMKKLIVFALTLDALAKPTMVLPIFNVFQLSGDKFVVLTL